MEVRGCHPNSQRDGCWGGDTADGASCPPMSKKAGTLTISRDKDDAVLAQSRHFNVNAVYSIADTFRPRYKICSAVGPLCPRSWLCDHEVYKARMNTSQIQALPAYTHSLLARGEDTM